jgi:hypothetical protein
MPIGFSLGTDRGERFVSINEYNHETVSKSVIFPNKNWNRFIQLLPQIEDCMMNNEFLDFKQQVNGFYFVSVITCHNYINLCEYFYNPVNGVGPEVITSITIPLDDWINFKTNILLVDEKFAAGLSWDYV